MNHAIRRCSNDHDAQLKGSQILLVLKTPIHAQQDIENPLSTPKQLTVRRARPACGLHGADLVSRQLGGESTRQILVKQNTHGRERNSEPDRARRAPVALRPTETDRGSGRASLPLPSSRTAPEPAPACREKPACHPRFPGRCGRPRAAADGVVAHQPCDQHTLIGPACSAPPESEGVPAATAGLRRPFASRLARSPGDVGQAPAPAGPRRRPKLQR